MIQTANPPKGEQGRRAGQKEQGALSGEVEAAGRGRGRLRGGTSTEPGDACLQRRSGFNALYKKVGLFRKEARKWGEVQVLKAEWGLGQASLVTGTVPRSPAWPGPPSARAGSVEGSACLGRPWPFLLRTPVSRNSEGPQLREAGAGKQQAGLSRAPSSNP